MTDEKIANEIRAEGLREDFYQALHNADWDECRACLNDIEEMKIDTYELRREMNQAMEEDAAKYGPDDYSNSTVESYGL